MSLCFTYPVGTPVYDLVTTCAKTIPSELSLQQTKATNNGDPTSSQRTDGKAGIHGTGKKRKRTASEGQSDVPSKRMHRGMVKYFVVVRKKLTSLMMWGRGGHLYFRLDIILVNRGRGGGGTCISGWIPSS